MNRRHFLQSTAALAASAALPAPAQQAIAFPAPSGDWGKIVIDRGGADTTVVFRVSAAKLEHMQQRLRVELEDCHADS